MRVQVCDKRERLYERNGMGSSYMFRIDKSCVIDATPCGSSARLGVQGLGFGV